MSLLAALGDSASSSLPRHVAIIMDGNGRWAQNRGKMRVSGHKAGVKSVREAVAFAARAKMEALTLFAFSSENWRRPEGEVNALMELFMTVLGREVNKLHSNGIRLKVIGDTARFSERLQAKIAKAEARHHPACHLGAGRGRGDVGRPAHDRAVGGEPCGHLRDGGWAVVIVERILAARPDEADRAS